MRHRLDGQPGGRTLWVPASIASIALVIEILLLFYGFDQPGRSGKDARGKPLAVLADQRRDVRQKAVDTLIWGSPEAGARLFAQDSIATMASSEATLRFFDGSEMIVEANSLIVLEEAPSAA